MVLFLSRSGLLIALSIFQISTAVAETLNCNLQKVSPHIDRFPTQLRLEVDPARLFVLITDNTEARPSDRAARGEIIRDDNTKFSVKWELNGLRQSTIQNSSIAYTSRARYRASYFRNGGKLILSVQANPWKPPTRLTGSCTLAS